MNWGIFKMGTKESLPKIIKDLKKGRFNYELHALQRMNEREVSTADIECLICEGLNNRSYRQDHESWNFFGHGLDNELLTISVKYINGTTIVTVY